MKLVADKKRTDAQFEEDEWVYIKLKPYHQVSMRLQRHHKLGRKYVGPLKVVKRIGNVAYKLDLPDSARIHSVFHILLLKRCVGQPDQQVIPLFPQELESAADANLEDKVLNLEGGTVMNEKGLASNWEYMVDQGADVDNRRRGQRIKKPNCRLGDYVVNHG